MQAITLLQSLTDKTGVQQDLLSQVQSELQGLAYSLHQLGAEASKARPAHTQQRKECWKVQ
jgi:hypothetical protein